MLVLSIGLAAPGLAQKRSVDSTSPAGDGHAPPAAAAAVPDEIAPADDHHEYFPGVRADYLREVEDGTAYREANPWSQLLELLRETSEQDVERASLGPVDGAQLRQYPDEYRGRVVMVAGTVRRVELRTAMKLNTRSSSLPFFRLWLQPDRSAPELIVVDSLSLPDGFRVGTELNEPCTTTGIFFKNLSEDSGKDTALAPLVLARSIDWQPRSPAPTLLPEAQVAWVVAAFTMAVVIVGCLIGRGRSTSPLQATQPGGSSTA